MPEINNPESRKVDPATNELLKFVDFVSDSIKSVILRPSKYKRRINRRKYLRKQVNRYREKLQNRETKFMDSVQVLSLQSLFDFSAQTNSNKPFRTRDLPPSFFSEPQRNSLPDKEMGTSLENFLHSPNSKDVIASGECTCISQTTSGIYENDSSDEHFVPSVSMESLLGLEEWGYIDSIASTLPINAQSTIQKY